MTWYTMVGELSGVWVESMVSMQPAPKVRMTKFHRIREAGVMAALVKSRRLIPLGFSPELTSSILPGL